MSGSLGERWRRSGGPRRRIELPDGKPPGSGSRGPAGLPYPTAAGPMVHPRHRASALPDRLIQNSPTSTASDPSVPTRNVYPYYYLCSSIIEGPVEAPGCGLAAVAHLGIVRGHYAVPGDALADAGSMTSRSRGRAPSSAASRCRLVSSVVIEVDGAQETAGEWSSRQRGLPVIPAVSVGRMREARAWGRAEPARGAGRRADISHPCTRGRSAVPFSRPVSLHRLLEDDVNEGAPSSRSLNDPVDVGGHPGDLQHGGGV